MKDTDHELRIGGHGTEVPGRELEIDDQPGALDVVAVLGEVVVASTAEPHGDPSARAEMSTEAGQHIARYKLPKEILFRDKVLRSPSGKADYRWARAEVS